jgi:hypothetical protein
LEIEVNFHHCCHCCHIAPASELPYFKGISANLRQQWQQFYEKQKNGAKIPDHNLFLEHRGKDGNSLAIRQT